MVREVGAGEARYRAFVSYSHRDQAFGRRLHRQLERYAVPRRLVGRLTARGPTPKRVAPVFRDREELSAAHDLTAEIRAALSNSGALIVVCSPNAAASPWVAREIELFRELHPDRPVLAALAAGEPGEAFPLPLTRAGGATTEPLAADFRRDGDGPRLGLLKLVAGVLGLGVDELVQRDAQRRLRGVMAVTGAALAGMLAMGLLTTVALTSRAEAERHRAEAERQREIAERQTVEALRQSGEARRQRSVALANEAEAARQAAEARRQRAEAEALVEFMLTDLRDRLKSVGRLDAMGAVNAKTEAYYAPRVIKDLPVESRARYARIVLAIGEDDMTRGDPASAFARFRAAEATTAALAAASPNDPERVWGHAQSQYWLGYHAYRSGDRAGAEGRWRKYRALAQRLVSLRPAEAKYRRELAYAEGNLCTWALAEPADPAQAVRHCRAALSEMSAVALMPGPHPNLEDDIQNRRAWLADAYVAARQLPAALAEREIEEAALARRMRDEPRNMRLKRAWVVQQRAMASLEAGMGDLRRARARLVGAQAAVSEMTSFDPINSEWLRLRDRVDSALAYVDQQLAKDGKTP